MRGTRTSRICRLPASKTSPTICRSSWLSVWVLVTSSRTSCSVMAWRPTRGSPPRTATTRLVDAVSSQTTGRARVAIRSSSGAASSASRGARCSPIRLGASSPRIRLKKVMQMVTTTNETGPAQPADMLLPDQPRLQQVRERRGPVGAGDQRGQRHADLHGGEEPVRVLRQLGRPLAALAALGQRPDLAFAQRNQGHLRGREEPPDADDDEDDNDVQDDLAHFLSAARSVPARLRAPLKRRFPRRSFVARQSSRAESLGSRRRRAPSARRRRRSHDVSGQSRPDNV